MGETLMRKRLVALMLCALILLSSCSFSGKKVDFDYFYDNFNPLSVLGGSNLSAVALTQSYILTMCADESTDSIAYIDYEAHKNGIGIADIEVNEAEDRSTVEYTVKIGDDIKFSDGSDVTARDVAFTLYACCDIDYIGWAPVRYAGIVGVTDYRYKNSAADEIIITDEQIENELKDPSPETVTYLQELVIIPVLEEEYRWVEHLYTDPAYKGTEGEELIKEYPEAPDLFAYYYSTDENYLPARDKEALIDDIADMFVTDIDLLSTIYGSDLKENAKECARRTLTEKALASAGGERVNYISGINIIDGKTLTVTLNDISEDALEKALGVFVIPFEVYGKNCTFDGKGFEIDIDSVLSSTHTPVGAGPCVFEGYTAGKGVKFSANKNYFKEAPFECDVMLVETGNSRISRDNEYYTILDERLVVAEK